MDFWRNEGVYDWVDPVNGSLDALMEIKRVIGCDIIAVSHCKGNHFKSKWQFLKRNFGNTIDGFIATKEKYYVACDILIDDRNSYLNKMPDGIGCIRFDTCYTQDEEPTRLMKVCKDWEEITEYLLLHY
jgi:5'(3')-deoxyribonucleotidase